MNISSNLLTQPYTASYTNPQNNAAGQDAQPQLDAAQADGSSQVKKGHHGHHGQHAHHAHAKKPDQQVQTTSNYSAPSGQSQQNNTSVNSGSTIDFTA